MQKFNFVILSLLYSTSDAFTGPSPRILQTRLNIPQISSETKLNVKSPPDKEVQTISRPITNDEEERLGKTFGGYTVKQRLREEVESPFNKAIRGGLINFTSGDPKSGPQSEKLEVVAVTWRLCAVASWLTVCASVALFLLSLLVIIKVPLL